VDFQILKITEETMLIDYTDADGKIIKLEVAEEIGNFYLESVRNEKLNERRETRRHTSIEYFTYGGKQFSDGTDFISDLVESEIFGQAMSF
jgi:hypothetical protein